MEIAVVGQLEFTLGFQLAGVENLYNPSDDEELAAVSYTHLTLPTISDV